MDNLTHTLIGVGMARAGLAQRFGKGTTWTLAIASNLPDIDTFWTIWDRWDYFLLRRCHSHSLLALPILAALLAVALRLWLKHIPFKVLFGLSMLGAAVHLLCDLLNAYGVVLFCPLSWHRYELGCTFIVDMRFWLITLAPIVVAAFRVSDRTRTRAFQASLGVAAAYVIVCLAARARAEALIARHLEREGVRASTVRVFPEPFGPHRFRAVAKSGREYRVYLCRVLSGECEPRRAVPTDEGEPRVEEVRRTEPGRKLEWFMAAPAWTLEKDGTVAVRDLRFDPELAPWQLVRFIVRFAPGSVKPEY